MPSLPDERVYRESVPWNVEGPEKILLLQQLPVEQQQIVMEMDLKTMLVLLEINFHNLKKGISNFEDDDLTEVLQENHRCAGLPTEMCIAACISDI